MEDYSFVRCEHGFLFRETTSGLISKIWAFTTIEEAAQWLTDRYPPPMTATPSPAIGGGE